MNEEEYNDELLAVVEAFEKRISGGQPCARPLYPFRPPARAPFFWRLTR